ncbi:hypothetical protein [Streptomyces neyagawaensis]|uniref:Uncharacterized protein n=1 Tax=Streptomyces neyagawaensis TaxID=42238 RepID=A0ABV3B3Q4_9ACTN
MVEFDAALLPGWMSRGYAGSPPADEQDLSAARVGTGGNEQGGADAAAATATDWALHDDRCRSCHPYRLIDQARPASRRFTQLVIALPTGKGGPFETFPIGAGQVPAYDGQRPALHTSRGQEALFISRSDWAPVLARLLSMPSGEPPLTMRWAFPV